MGHFTGVALQVVVGDPDSLAGEFFDAIFDDGAEAFEAFDLLDRIILRRDKAEFIASIYNESAYFDAWDWRVVEETKKGRRYSSRASTRYTNRGIFLAIFNLLKDSLVVSEGDVVYREVYESSGTENVIAFVGGEFVPLEVFGWEGGEEHDDHPSNKDKIEGQTWKEYLAWEETWFHDWNIKNLNVQGEAPIE